MPIGHVVTPAYLAPERIADAPVQPAADVYGLGVLLYRALTGSLPWPADTSTGLLRAHMFAEPMPMPAIDELPPDVAQICAACLDKDPHARPSSAELANTLWLATLTSNAAISPAPAFFASSAPTSPAPASPRRPASTSPDAMTGAMASAMSMTQSLARSGRGAGSGRATGLPSPTDHPQGRCRAYMSAAAIMTISVALLGVAWGSLGRGDDSSASYAGASPCFADFAVDRDWGNGFSGHVTVTNASDVALRGWRLEFTFPGGQHLSPASATTTGITNADTNAGNTNAANTNARNTNVVETTNSAGHVMVTPTEGQPYAAAITQTGTTVVAQTVGAPALAVSQSVAVPISANYSGMNRMPTAVALNGTDCQTKASTPTPATNTAAPDPTHTTTTMSGSSGKTGGEDGNGQGHGGGHGKSGGHSGKG